MKNKGMSKLKRMTAILLCAVMMLSCMMGLGWNQVEVQAAEINLSLDSLSIKKDGVVVSPTTKVKNGDTLDIVINFSLDNTEGNGYTVDDVFFINLSPMQNLSGIMAPSGVVSIGATKVGTFSIDGDKVKIKFTEESLFEQNNIIGNVMITAQFDVDESTTEDESAVTIKIADKTADVIYEEVVPTSSVNISKSAATDIVVDGGKTYQQYTITITSVGENSTVTINDTLTGDLTFPSSGTYAGGTYTAPNGSVTSVSLGLNDNKNFTYNIGNMSDGQTATLSYYVEVASGAYVNKWGSDNQAEVKYTNNESTPDTKPTGKVNPNVANLSMWKTGTKGSGDTVLWTLVVTGGDISDGYVLTDLENIISAGGGTISDQYVGGITVKHSDGTETTITDFSNVIIGTTVPSVAKGETLTFTYKTEYDTSLVNPVVGMSTQNVVTATKPDYPTQTAQATVKVEDSLAKISLGKQFKTYDDANDEITWVTTLNIPYPGYTDVVYTDTVGAGHAYVDGSMTITKDSAPFAAAVTTTATGFEINLGDNQIATEGQSIEYVFTYKTKCDSSNTLKLVNTANVTYKYGTTELSAGPVSAEFNKGVLTNKWCSREADSDKVLWCLELDISSVTLGSSDKFTIEDVLPDNMVIVDESFRSVKNNWENYSAATMVSKNVITGSEGTVVFDLTELVKEYKAEGVTNMRFFYVTQIKDISKAVNNTEYKNLATARKNDISLGNKSASTWFSLPLDNVLDKQSHYDRYTAPYVNYTISINPNGYDLVEGTDTLEVIDTLGSALVYLNDAKVVNTDTGVEITGVDKSYNQVTGELRLIVPDETPCTITYSVYLNMSVGTDMSALTGEEAESVTNTVKIQGITYHTFEKENKLTSVVYSSAGAVYPSSVKFSITKYDASDVAKVLEGAQFKITMVKPEGDSFVEVATGEDGYKGPITITTDEFGIAVANTLLYDKYYKYEEIKAPDGYDIGPVSSGYIIFEGKDYSSVQAAPTGIKVVHFVYGLNEGSASVANEKLPDNPGTLIITKTLAGGITDDELNDGLTFTIEGTSGNSFTARTLTLSDFTQDTDDENKYTYTLKVAEGGYKVTETSKDVSGYKFVSVSYCVNGADSQISEEKQVSVDTDVVKDGTTIVDFTNTYEKQTATAGPGTPEQPDISDDDDEPDDKEQAVESVSTGDDTPIAMMLMLLSVSIILMVLSGVTSKKNNKEKYIKKI